MKPDIKAGPAPGEGTRPSGLVIIHISTPCEARPPLALSPLVCVYREERGVYAASPFGPPARLDLSNGSRSSTVKRRKRRAPIECITVDALVFIRQAANSTAR